MARTDGRCGVFYIHIGAHKVGSTSLQRFFALNSDLLGSLGITYPQVGLASFAHHPLAKAFTETKQIADREAQVAALSRLAASEPHTTFLLSSEVFEFARPAGIRMLREAIAPHDARIILYLRDFTKLIPSKYAQRTKTGGNHKNFDEFLNIAHEMRWLGFSKLAAGWAGEFGWDALRVRVLEKDFLVGGDLLRDVWAVLGLPPEAFERCGPASLEPVNTSPGWVALEAVREVNRQLLQAELGLPSDQKLKGMKRTRAKTDANGAIDALRIGNLADICEGIAHKLDLADKPGRYLSREQWTSLNRLYRIEIGRLNARLPGEPLPLPDAKPPEERPFLPQLSALSAEEKARFGRQVMLSRAVRRLPPAVLVAVASAFGTPAPRKRMAALTAMRHRAAGTLKDLFDPPVKRVSRKQEVAAARNRRAAGNGEGDAQTTRRPTLMRRVQRRLARWTRWLRGVRKERRATK